MAYIELPEGYPGLQGLLVFRPQWHVISNEIAELLLRESGTESFTWGDRQVIAAWTLHANGSLFAHMIHGAVAAALLDGDEELVEQIKSDYTSAPISAKLKALLRIAEQVVESGLSVTPEAVADARAQGASDLEIHDTVLIASQFCMYSRYIDGLGTEQPSDPGFYRVLAARIVEKGYRGVGAELRQRAGTASVVGEPVALTTPA